MSRVSCLVCLVSRVSSLSLRSWRDPRQHLLQVPRSNTSIGDHVRDAACYVAWAFARAFAPAIVEPYMPARPSLIPSLCTQFTRAGIGWRRCQRAVCMARPDQEPHRSGRAEP